MGCLVTLVNDENGGEKAPFRHFKWPRKGQEGAHYYVQDYVVYDYDNDCYYQLMLKPHAGKMWFKFNLRSEIRESSWESLGDMIPYGDVFFIRLKKVLQTEGHPLMCWKI